MSPNLCLLVLVSEVLALTTGSIWTIRLRSHPYKTQLWTAEVIKEPRRYFWCADHIRLEDAVVLCNQVSEFTGLGPYTLTSPPVEFGALHYDPAVSEAFTNETFFCAGDEARLSDCPTVPVAERCPSGNLGQVDCHPADNANKNMTITMLDSPLGEGRGLLHLQSSMRGLSGLICDETGSFRFNEARVACRSLGFSGQLAAPIDPGVVPSNSSLAGQFVIKNVHCDGSESTLNECRHTDMCQAADFLDRSFICPDSCATEPAAVLCG